LIAAA